MIRLHDLRCVECQAIELDVYVGDPFPPCPNCGGERTWIPSRVNTDIQGGPKYYASLDATFDSKSDLKTYLKANGLSEAGDKKGGARNESHLNLGKTFSYRGQASRTTASEGK